MFKMAIIIMSCLAVMAFALVSGCAANGGPAGVRARKAPQWRLGMQAYTFRKFTFFEAVDKTAALGLKYIEAYPGQRLSPDQPDVKFDHDLSAEAQARVKSKLNEAGVNLALYGVASLVGDEAADRKVFDFARNMGIETITAEPGPATLKLLDKLTVEYGINVAVHNHPKRADRPDYRHWNPEEVLKMIEGCNPRIGVCADTGHWLRSGVNPVEALRKLEGRIISLHFKDLSKAAPDAHDVPWGTGACDVKAMLTELHRQGFSGVFSIEYEHKWENNMPEIAECIKYFNQAAQELGVAKSTR